MAEREKPGDAQDQVQGNCQDGVDADDHAKMDQQCRIERHKSHLFNQSRDARNATNRAAMNKSPTAP
jgi:hypothetical protein